MITTATLNRDVTKGTLIQAEDYTLSELTVPETSPMISSDLKAYLKRQIPRLCKVLWRQKY
ncbi:flp operon protein C [Actinobacillus equuli]|nr:flp operon protein C [Actinobacillus equuli]